MPLRRDLRYAPLPVFAVNPLDPRPTGSHAAYLGGRQPQPGAEIEGILLRIALAIPALFTGGLLYWAGRQIRSGQKTEFIALPRRLKERVRDRAGFTRWVGTGLMIGGARVLALAALLMRAPAGPEEPLLWGWLALFLLLYAVLAFGGKRFCRPADGG